MSEIYDLTRVNSECLSQKKLLAWIGIFGDNFDTNSLNLVDFKEVELNASEPCAVGNKKPTLEESTRSRNISVVSDAELELRKKRV